ncbi:hypothetical protein LCGC14_0318030 [marine sediment metagenome]|uniref:Uncharacterized protein n=1 Tax=marine sediment metagenome TaxID=412755 RepID=A0A0F9TQC3_9ZZZZ
MAHEDLTKRQMRVEFIKAIITGTLGDKSPYINYAEPEKKIAKQAWSLGNALAEMEMKKREEERASKDPNP